MNTKSVTRTTQVNSKTLSQVIGDKSCREYFIHLNVIEKYEKINKRIEDYFEWRENENTLSDLSNDI